MIYTINSFIAALGIAPRGIPFECLDGRPAKLFILLILPKKKFQSHVRTLAGIAHVMRQESFRRALVDAPDVDTVLDLIENEEDKAGLHDD